MKKIIVALAIGLSSATAFADVATGYLTDGDAFQGFDENGKQIAFLISLKGFGRLLSEEQLSSDQLQQMIDCAQASQTRIIELTISKRQVPSDTAGVTMTEIYVDEVACKKASSGDVGLWNELYQK